MSTVRLDKYVSSALILSRKDAFSVIRAGRISVNGSVLKKADAKVDPSSDEVTFDGGKLVYSEFVYVMLNKPSGLICASYDAKEKTVFSLFPKEYADKGINCVGRLDKDACGLLLMTNDGILSHKLLSPKNSVSKKYFVTCLFLIKVIIEVFGSLYYDQTPQVVWSIGNAILIMVPLAFGIRAGLLCFLPVLVCEIVWFFHLHAVGPLLHLFSFHVKRRPG